MSSSRTQEAGLDEVDLSMTLHSALMSESLVGVVDAGNIYGDEPVEDRHAPVVTGRPRMSPVFRCVVTLLDEQKLTCVVQNVSRHGDTRSVCMHVDSHVADAIATGVVTCIEVLGPSGASVFSAEFDHAADEAPDMTLDSTGDAFVVALSYTVSRA